MNFVKHALESGGSIHSLILPIQELQGPALTNPSIYNDNGKILVNLRNINYTLYHAEKNKYENHWGPLVYIHPDLVNPNLVTQMKSVNIDVTNVVKYFFN